MQAVDRSAHVSRARVDRVLLALRRPAQTWGRVSDALLGRLERRGDANSPYGSRIRKLLALLVGLAAAVLWAQTLAHGQAPALIHILLAILAFALYTNRGGRFVRDWLPVLIVGLLYVLADSAVGKFKLSVFYSPQIDLDKVIGFGSVPTVWLQSHLYHGHIGPLEIFTALMYLSHFVLPLALAFGLWAFWSKRAFSDLLFGILIVTVLGEVTFMLAPTAPPWVAAQHGLISPVQPILKDAFYSMHMTKIANATHSQIYDTVAAVPSLHIAWPTIGLLVVLKHRLPKIVVALQATVLLSMLFAIVYMGEHYVTDALVGIGYALGSWWLLQRALAADARPAVTARRPGLPEAETA